MGARRGTGGALARMTIRRRLRRAAVQAVQQVARSWACCARRGRWTGGRWRRQPSRTRMRSQWRLMRPRRSGPPWRRSRRSRLLGPQLGATPRTCDQPTPPWWRQYSHPCSSPWCRPTQYSRQYSRGCKGRAGRTWAVGLHRARPQSLPLGPLARLQLHLLPLLPQARHQRRQQLEVRPQGPLPAGSPLPPPPPPPPRPPPLQAPNSPPPSSPQRALP